jgi:hypothetical protein
MEYNFYRADDDLINYEQLKDMKRNKRGRNRNKEKAEFQFNAFAAPIKLETFFKDIMDCEPNLPDDTIELTGLEECAYRSLRFKITYTLGNLASSLIKKGITRVSTW